VTGTTPMALSGPVTLDHPAMQSAITPSPLGTLNNCGSGYTPWGTYLACEENWNGYFGTGADNAAADAWTNTQRTPDEARYGVTGRGFGYAWHRAEPRFDVAVNRNELNHFGWIVEVDPFDPSTTPVKRTALGRIKHEGATVTESNGRVVVYSGDDENGDYVYKFVGSRPWRQVRAQGGSPLDEGTLYVARFAEDGSGVWLPLVAGQVPEPADRPGIFATQADVLLRTRLAADAVGATRLHRPEWVAVHPRTSEVYLALTNGNVNGAAAVNSGRPNNPYGHVIRWREDRDDNTSLSFRWDVFVYGGDPQYPAIEGDKTPEGQSLFGSPDGMWVDGDGRVWIQTDISNSVQNSVAAGYDRIGNNQMLAADPDTGEIRRFLTGPRGCEVTGCITTPDGRTMFVNIQHPGESTTFWNAQFGAPSVSNPTTVSAWPGNQFPEFGTSRPRPATVVIRKIDGGVIGS
jgi:secreted PhoX family phosphatase